MEQLKYLTPNSCQPLSMSSPYSLLRLNESIQLFNFLSCFIKFTSQSRKVFDNVHPRTTVAWSLIIQATVRWMRVSFSFMVVVDVLYLGITTTGYYYHYYCAIARPQHIHTHHVHLRIYMYVALPDVDWTHWHGLQLSSIQIPSFFCANLNP